MCTSSTVLTAMHESQPDFVHSRTLTLHNNAIYSVSGAVMCGKSTRQRWRMLQQFSKLALSCLDLFFKRLTLP